MRDNGGKLTIVSASPVSSAIVRIVVSATVVWSVKAEQGEDSPEILRIHSLSINRTVRRLYLIGATPTLTMAQSSSRKTSGCCIAAIYILKERI